MRKLIIVLLSFSAVSSAVADLTWGYAGDFTGVMIPNSHLGGGARLAESGFHVQMYHDPAGESDLNTFYGFSIDGTPNGGSGFNDDLLLSFTSSLTSGKGGLIFGESIPSADWSALLGEDVYTVVFSGTSIAASQGGLILDPTPFTLPRADPSDYVIAPIPEPSTLGLMGMAGIAVFLSRKKSHHPKPNDSK